MTAQDDSDPTGRRASRRETAADDALDVARFCRPRSNPARPGSEFARQEDEADRNWIWNNIAAAEAVLVERGLGEEYARQLADELAVRWEWSGVGGVLTTWNEIRLLLVAPLDARLRAMAAVVRKQQEKEA